MFIERNPEYGINRVFDPVQKYKHNDIDCVFIICAFLQTDGLRRVPIKGIKVRGGSDDDFRCLKINIDRLCRIEPSKKNIKIELVIIVNGYITDEKYIIYLDNLNGIWITDYMRVKVFQRPNIGWKWGALWDVWNGYKESGCKWWICLEQDLYINKLYYLDVGMDLLKYDKYCWVSYIKRTKIIESPYEYYGNLPLDIWRDKNNKPLYIESKEDIHCSGGSFHFIKRNVLDDMEDTFGTFTYAIGDSYELDAIVHGEIGFSQKANVLDYDFIVVPDFVIPDKREKFMYQKFLDDNYKDILE